MTDTPKPATPLPWMQFDEFLVVAQVPSYDGHMNGKVADTEDGEYPEEVNQENAAYIAHACNAYPELTAEVERLRNQLREVEEINLRICRHYCEWFDSGMHGDASNVAYDLYCMAAYAAQQAKLLPEENTDV